MQLYRDVVRYLFYVRDLTRMYAYRNFGQHETHIVDAISAELSEREKNLTRLARAARTETH